jgi:hypothetical protein
VNEKRLFRKRGRRRKRSARFAKLKKLPVDLDRTGKILIWPAFDGARKSLFIKRSFLL